MERPPPYEPDAGPGAPKFHIRQASQNDAVAINNLHNHMVHKSARATSNGPVGVEKTKGSILKPPIPEIIQIVAVPITQPSTSGISGLVQKFKTYTIDKLEDSKGKVVDITAGIGILGYAILVPYTDGVAQGVRCYDRTARLYVSSLEESVVGPELYLDVNRALIDEAIERRCDRFKTVLTSMTFSEEEPGLVRWRAVLIDRGFDEVGRFRGVVEKWGKIMDRVFMQKDVETRDLKMVEVTKGK
jgi:L-amino acid N-acyltransferase YncA